MSEFEEYDKYEEPSFEVIEHYFYIGNIPKLLSLLTRNYMTILKIADFGIC